MLLYLAFMLFVASRLAEALGWITAADAAEALSFFLLFAFLLLSAAGLYRRLVERHVNHPA